MKLWQAPRKSKRRKRRWTSDIKGFTPENFALHITWFRIFLPFESAHPLPKGRDGATVVVNFGGESCAEGEPFLRITHVFFGGSGLRSLAFPLQSTSACCQSAI